MEIRFWGVRGSIASPGPSTAGVGGNTSCVEVRCGDQKFALDAGTGIRGLGNAWMSEGPVDATLLLSHLHWDHIQGLPFFVPLYLPTTTLQVIGASGGKLDLPSALAAQMRAPLFPIAADEVPSRVSYQHLAAGETITRGDVTIKTQKLAHPGGGVTAFRIEHGGRSVVYATDTEHYACLNPKLLALAKDADVLIYDSQYTPEEYRGERGPSKVGWGHSTYEAGAALAEAAGVSAYYLFHHDPARDDEGVAGVERLAQDRFQDAYAAREGETITLVPEERDARAA